MKARPSHWILALAFLGIIAWFGYSVQQHEFDRILIAYAGLFGLYAAIWWAAKEQQLRFFLIIAWLARVSLLFALPLLSDDLYRFIWDGRLINQGINPFEALPSYYMGLENPPPGLTPELFAELNSPNYFTIYPPVNQLVFAVATWLFPNSIWGSSLVMKLFLLAFETGSLILLPKLLKRFNLPPKNALLYALNPLIIIEVSGNLHFEGAMVFFLLLALWFLAQKKNTLSALAMAGSIASKLLPLMFLPLLIRRLGIKNSVRYFAVVGISLILLFLPLVSGVFLDHFGESLDLYFRKFEFNASMYYLLRWVGYQFAGYNLIAYIGPALAACTFVLICSWAFIESWWSVEKLPLGMLFAICVYLLCTTTVHPWYVSLPVVLCLFTRYRFPILWSGLITLTYINYSYPEYYENLTIVSIEYGLVALYLIYEILKIKRSRRSSSLKPGFTNPA